MIYDEGPTEEGVGCVFVPASILLAALLIWSLGCQPAEALEGCVDYSTICVPGYLVRWLPPVPEIAPSPGYGPLVAKYWPPALVGWALAIMDCESGGDRGALNPASGAAGLFQFLESTWDRGPAPALGLPPYRSGAIFVAEWNIQAAAWLYANWGGTSQWSCKA